MNTLSMFADPVTQRIKRRGPDDYPTWARHGVIDLGYHGKTLAHIVQGPRTHRQRPSMISMAQFHIQLCGRMSITGPHGVIDQRELSGVVGRQILAMLALANGPVGRYELVDMVWHGQPTKAVDSTVNATLSRLRAAIAAAGGDPNVMTSEQGLIELAGYQFTTDFGNAVTAIDRTMTMLHSGEYGLAWGQAATTYSITTRTLLPGVENTWVDHRRDQMRHMTNRALAVVVMAAMGRQRPHDAIFAARELVRHDPHSDRGIQLLVATLLAAGDRGASRAAVHDWAIRLQSELGVLPDDHTMMSLDAAINRRSNSVIDIAQLIPLTL